MSDFYYGANLDFNAFDSLLSKDDLVEEPVPLEVFVEDAKYLGMHPLSIIQAEIVKQSTQIYRPDTLQAYMGMEAGQLYYNEYTSTEVVAQLGKGSGKDHCSRIAMARIAYLLHCLRDPLDYFGKGHDVTLDLVNVAVNAKQAQSVFFDPLKKLLLASPYFQDKGFDPRSQEIFFFDRPIRMFSGHSESESWEGYETLVFVLDEISAFKADIELTAEIRNRGSAATIYNMAKASVTSRFPTVGKVILLSFPRFRDDFIQSRYKTVLKDITDSGGTIELESMGNRGKDFETLTWAVKACTWEVNPFKEKSEFEHELRRDPIQSRARYMCEPPEMEDAYFRDPESVRRAFNMEDDPFDDNGQFKPWFNGTDQHMRFIHVDLAAKHDRAAMAMVHSPGFMKVRTFGDNTETLPIIKMDYLESWEAKQYEEIPFDQIRERIVYLCRKFDVGLVTFDQWQSVDMIQSLKAKGINAELHGVKKTDYDTLSSAIYDGRFKGYWNEILVEKELLKLQILKNNKIDHPTTGSKDLADSVAGATFGCVENLQSDETIEIEIFGMLGDEDLDDISDDFFGASDGNSRGIAEKILPSNDDDSMPEEFSEWLELL